MRVGTAEINLHNLVNRIKARNMAKRMRTPNCTHLDMDRVYGRDQQCDVCGHMPSIGFLYKCRQDCDAPSLHDLLSKDDDSTEVVKSDMRLQLQWLRLSESVIITAEQGQYTDAQLEKLKTQKKDMQQIISDSLQGSRINSAAAKLAALAQAPSNHDGAFNSNVVKDTSPPACTLKACHTCRPYYRDRVYISFQSVFEGDFPPVTCDDVEILPTKSAQIMRTIGSTRHSFNSLSTSNTTPLSLPTSTSLATSTDAPPTASTSSSTSTSESSDLTFKTTQTDLDEISAQRRPRRRFYKMGHRSSSDIARDLSRQSNLLTRQGLRTAFQGIFRPSRDSSSSGSNITLPLPRTGIVRDPDSPRDVGDFDLPSLRKVWREKERNEMKNGTYLGGHQDVHAHASATNLSAQTAINFASAARDDERAAQEASTSDSNLTMYTCTLEGSEVEVDGGVALTEEAVEMHTPDILAVHVSRKKTGVVVQDEDMDDDDSGVDIGLQSIMAQV